MRVHNHLYLCHTRFAVFLPSPSYYVSSLIWSAAITTAYEEAPSQNYMQIYVTEWYLVKLWHIFRFLLMSNTISHFCGFPNAFG